MNFLHRLFACAALCGSVACSENGIDFDTAAPEQQFRTVVIGCGGIDITTRTEIDENSLDVRWVSGDSIRLWARESLAGGGVASGFVLEKHPFVFNYYSPQFKQAAFTGHKVDMSGFDSDRRYDYFAVSPTPASVSGTSATFDIPAVQSGEFNSGCDIMTAQLPNAVALEEGDTNWSIRLPFEHHVHVLKITIPSNRLESPKFPGQEEAIRAIELTFPDPVTGRLTVDATGATAPVFTPVEGGNVLTLRFDQPKRAGEVVYAFIARQEPLSGDGKVVIKAIGASGGDKPCVSVDRTFAKTSEFKRGGVTTLNYNIPERYRCTKILFSLAEKAGGEAPDRAITEANGYGWGTLGEPIESFRIVDKATGEELPESAFVCNHVANRYEITCVDEGAHTAFIQRYAGKECIAKLTSVNAEVEYPFTMPALETEVENTVPALEVPYLFEEDFSGITGSNGRDEGTIMLSDYGMPANGWSISRYMIAEGRVACFVYVGSSTGMDIKHGRLDSPFLPLNASADVSLAVSYDIGGARIGGAALFGSSYWVSVCEFGTDTREGTLSGNESIEKRCCSFTPDVGGSLTSDDLPMSRMELVENCTAPIRLSWRADYKKESHTGTAPTVTGKDFPIYLDNIKVSIAH